MKRHIILAAVMLVLIVTGRWFSHQLMFALSAACNVLVVLLLIVYAHLMDRASWKKD